MAVGRAAGGSPWHDGPCQRRSFRVGSHLPQMVMRPLIRVLLFALAGALFGRVISIIPSPEVHEVFWVANLSSPWLLLSFLAGFAQRSYRWGGVAGVAADVSCVLGFYAGFLSLDPLRYGLPASAPLLQVAFASLANWLVFIAPW